MQYFFAVVGPHPDIEIPLFVSAHLTANAGGVAAPRDFEELHDYAQAGATLFLIGDLSHPFLANSDRFFNVAESRTCVGFCARPGFPEGIPDLPNFNGILPLSTFSGGFGTVTMTTAAGASANRQHAHAGATLDPFIFIDPIFLMDNPGYTVLVSSGISNEPLPTTPAIPEPATFVLLGLGLAGMGLTRRWHLRKS